MFDLHKKAWWACDVPPEAFPVALAASIRACGEVPGALAEALGIKRQRLLDFMKTGEVFENDACDRGGLRHSEATQILEYLAGRHHLMIQEAGEKRVSISFSVKVPTA